jgi:proteasome lid subunit RPN8/RPN11
MSDELEIHLGQPNAQRPAPSMQAPRVLVARTVLRQVNSHLAADIGVERGGVLVGHVVDEDNTVQITGQIAADHAQATRDSFTFTHETWVAIGDKLESEFPGQQIVGWYHSHPNFGIFLSAHDKFIQTNFFSAPWHLAYVADPIRKELGFFGWHAGEIGPLEEWDLVDEPPAAGTTAAGTAASAPPTHSRRSDQASRNRWTRRTWTAIVLVCSAAMVLAGLWLLLPLDDGSSTTTATTGTTLPATEAAPSTVADVVTTSSAAPTTISSALDGTTLVSSPSTVPSGSIV